MLWATVDAVAGPVTAEAARQQAIQFFAQRGRAMTSADGLHLARRHAPAAGNIQAGAAYYVFNADKGGFVIVAGDDRAPAILGYSDQGRFDDATLPENMQAWLQGYADQMEWLGNHPEAATRQGDATPVKQPIAPMLTTEWNQGAPYNAMCPVFDEQRCVTGCLATALAQVVAYHGKRTGLPKGLTADIPSYETTDNVYKFTVDGVPAASVTFDWANMIDSYSGEYTDTQSDAVAQLMLCCGVGNRENYRPTSTSGWLDRVPNELKSYFGYDEGTRWLARENNYTLHEWNELVYSELVANRPVLYGGQSSGGGHAFVIDGYDGNELFHVNWGWGGNSNGYFLLSILNPDDNSGIGASSTSDGYSFEQEIIVGAQPAGQEGALGVSEEIGLTWSDIALSGATGISLTFTNATGVSRSFDYGLAWVGADGSLTLIGDASTTEELADKSTFTPTLNVPTTHAAGMYKVVPVSRVLGTDAWIATKNPSIFYVEVVYPYAESAPTLTLHPVNSFACESVTFPGSKFKGELQPVEVTLTNTGDEFCGVLYLFASTTETKGKYRARTGITLQQGKTDTFTLEFTPDAVGTWNVWIATDAAASNLLGDPTTMTVTTADRPHVSNMMFASLELPDANPASWSTDVDGYTTVDVYDKVIDVKISVQNVSGAALENVTSIFYIKRYNEATDTWEQVDRKQQVTPWASLPANGVGKFTMTTFNQDLAAGNTYSLELYYKLGGEEEFVGDTRYRIRLKKGFPVWDRQGSRSFVDASGGGPVVIADNVLCADLYPFDFSVDVTPNANPNTLYLLGSTQDVPTSLTGKNVVKGYTATNISLTDDGVNGFFTPIDFTAEAITYTRTFDKGYTSEGKNWSTIVLPFAATGCTARVGAADIPVDWYHSSSETGKNFWLMAFAGEDGATVNYTQAAAMQANKPYLIAVPGPEFGDRWDMQDLPVTFSATDAAISASANAATTGSSRKFVGTMVTTPTLTDIFALNDDGNHFTQQTTAVAPFRAYFTTPAISTPYTSLDIRFLRAVSAIDGVEDNLHGTAAGDALYDLQGRRMADGELPRGVYIRNGKKMIR